MCWMRHSSFVLIDRSIWNLAGCVERCVPMSSENPPTGRRQVPVTNWSRRILFSLSISFTTCRKTSPSVFCATPNWCVCVCVWVLPARTSESVCCFWCSVYKWCSSANLPDQSLASHRALATTDKNIFVFNYVSRGWVGTGRRWVPSPCQTKLNLAVGMWIYLGQIFHQLGERIGTKQLVTWHTPPAPIRCFIWLYQLAKCT